MTQMSSIHLTNNPNSIQVMKILFVTNDLSGQNGYSTYTNNILVPHLRVGGEALVALQDCSEKYEVAQYQIFTGGTLAYLWHPWRIYLAARKLQSIIDTERPDCIHFIVEPYQMTLAFLKIPRQTKVLLTAHGTYVHVPSCVTGLKRHLSRLLYKAAHKKVHTVIAVSETTNRRYVDRHNTGARPTVVIHNATNIAPLEAGDVPVKSEPHHAVTIGAVKRRKGITSTIQVLSKWSQENRVRVVYDVVGDCSPQSAYVSQAKQLAVDLSHEYFTTVFHGRVSEAEKNELLKNASVYTHLEPIGNGSLDVEGFGIGIVDAAAFGVPALVSKGTATEEAIVDGETGYAVDTENSDSICAKITLILLEKKLDPQSIINWANAHSVDNIYNKLIKIYHD